jgi:hypothetical protein
MKETVVSASENVRVVRLGGVRYDWRVERLVRELLRTLDSANVTIWKARKAAVIASAQELGWHRNDLGTWERE